LKENSFALTGNRMNDMAAPRAVWKGFLKVGSVTCGVKIVGATSEASKIHFKILNRKDGLPVKSVYADEKTGKTVDAEDQVKGFEVEKDRYVKFESEELAAIAPKNSPDMEIVEFVKAEEIDPVYLETSYYVAPDAGGEKPYSLLYEALKKSGFAAIGEFVMHRRDQILVLRPGSQGLIGHTLFYEDEVRRKDEFAADAGLVGAKEMDLAMKLVDALKGKFEPEKFKDKYRERLQAAIAAKVETGAVAEVSRREAAKAPVVDIMAALQESLKKARKPVAREAPAPEKKRTRKVSG